MRRFSLQLFSLILVISIVVVRRKFSCGRRSRKDGEGFIRKVQQQQRKERGKCERVVFFSVRIVFLSIFVWKLKEKKMAGRKQTAAVANYFAEFLMLEGNFFLTV